MKQLILILTCVLLAVPSLAANEQAQQPNSPKMQSSEIEKYLSSRKENIEHYYSDRLLELRLRTQADIRMLEVAEQPKPDCVGLDQWCEFAEAILQVNGIHNESYRLSTTSTASPAQQLAAVLSMIAKRKNDILADMEWQAVKLERQKNYALTLGFEKLRKRLNSNQLKNEPKATHGIIAGIIYTEDDPITIIDGIVVRENQQIHGVKIVKIHKDSVEFERNGKTWVQHIQENQQANWK